uniref:Uncharacterized protein n=1 Tax=Lepeophtheirus salmonis TaxID=72036 RepID=A0A0K2VBB3_LEPSM
MNTRSAFVMFPPSCPLILPPKYSTLWAVHTSSTIGITFF